MMKNDKKMKKKNEKKRKKNEKKMKKTQGKLQFFIFWKIAIFLEFFFHFSSFFINSTTGSKNDKKMIKK